MGVPKLFRTLTNRYPNILQQNVAERIDHLFFDLNCLIHPVCAECKGDENIMFPKIAEYIQKVASHVNPSKKVFLFMDGVAPLAKIQQQRQRRYKSLYLSKKRQEFEQTYPTNTTSDNIYNKTPKWDSNQISPDTKFMNDLEIYLKENFPQYIISGTNHPGEGEHKIVEYIFQSQEANSYSDSNETQRLFHVGQSSTEQILSGSGPGNICIYGLDADLILLSWIIFIKKKINVYLIRETQNFGVKVQIDQPFTFMSVPRLVDSFYIDLNLYGDKDMECVDFIFLSFILGNDFLPNIFGISLATRPDGLSLLLETYSTCRKKIPTFYLLNLKQKSLISWKNLSFFFGHLLKKKDRVYQNFLSSYLKYKPREPDFETITDKMMFEFEHNHKKIDPIGINLKDWEHRFSQRYFGIHDPDDKFSLNFIVDQYFAGLLWNTKYYFKTEQNLSFGYIYPYIMAPTIEMINLRLLETNEFNFDYFINSAMVPVKPLHPQIALRLILPQESYENIVLKHLSYYKNLSGKKTDEYCKIKFLEYEFLKSHHYHQNQYLDQENIVEIPYMMDFKHFWNESTLLLPPIEWKFYQQFFLSD